MTGVQTCALPIYGPLLVDRGRGKCKRLLQILFLQIWIILEEFQALRVCRKDFECAPDSDPHPADAGLSSHFSGLDRDPVERRLEIHDTIMRSVPQPDAVGEVGAEAPAFGSGEFQDVIEDPRPAWIVGSFPFMFRLSHVSAKSCWAQHPRWAIIQPAT